MSGFSASLSGVRASFFRQRVTGNNVANVNTSGFKSSRVHQASLGNENGTTVSSVATDLRQGSLLPTGRSTDAALDGDGYFVVEEGGREQFTRSGSFGLDAEGRLVNRATGGLVQGLEDGGRSPITVDSSDRVLTPEATDSFAFSGNLSAGMDVGETAELSPDAHNSRGGTQSVRLEFEKTAPNRYDLTAEDPNTGERALDASLAFDADGQVSAFDVGDSPNADGSFRGLHLSGREGASAIRVGESEIDVSGLTQQGGSTSLQPEAVSGDESGELTSVDLRSDGRLMGEYDNGRRRELGQLAVATFPNPEGLTDEGGSLVSPSANSGAPRVGAPGTGDRGSLRTGVLEASNVDLADELTDSPTNRSTLDANVNVLGVRREMTGSLLDLTG